MSSQHPWARPCANKVLEGRKGREKSRWECGRDEGKDGTLRQWHTRCYHLVKGSRLSPCLQLAAHDDAVLGAGSCCWGSSSLEWHSKLTKCSQSVVPIACRSACRRAVTFHVGNLLLGQIWEMQVRTCEKNFGIERRAAAKPPSWSGLARINNKQPWL